MISDIPVIQGLPVGKKMYDHPIFVGVQFTINKPEVINPYEVVGNINSYIDYFIYGKGIWTSIGKYLDLFTKRCSVYYLHTCCFYFANDAVLLTVFFSLKKSRGLESQCPNVLWRPIGYGC